MFPGDWDNFLERVSGLLGGAPMSNVTEADFGPGGPLHRLAIELQLWATFRCARRCTPRQAARPRRKQQWHA